MCMNMCVEDAHVCGYEGRGQRSASGAFLNHVSVLFFLGGISH